jgi:hypothetical protein
MAIQKQPIINFAAKMDARTNNEVLDIDPNSKGLELTYLSNGDLFYTKALTSRQGVQDIGGGIVNASGTPVPWYLYPSGNASPFTGTTDFPVYIADQYWDREGMIIVFGNPTISGTGNPVEPFNMASGYLYLQDNGTTGTVAEADYDIKVQMYLSKIQNNGVFSGNTAFYDQNGAFLHDINLGSNFNDTALYPQLSNPVGFQAIGSIVDPVPLAISEPTYVNFGPESNYTTGNAHNGFYRGTPWLQIPWQLSAPYPLQYDTPYYLKIVAFNTSGTSTRALTTQVTYSNLAQNSQPATSGRANTMYANEYLNFPTSNLLRPAEGNYPVTGVTGWLTGEIDNHSKASYMLMEYPGVATTMTAPMSGSLHYGAQQFNYGVNLIPSNTNTPYPVGTPAAFDTRSEEFGNVMTPPSGTWTINGGYVFANTWSGNNYRFFNAAGIPIDTQGYNVNYVCNFREITSTGLPYTTNLLASFTGSYTFNNQRQYQDSVNDIALAGINDELEILYGLFPQPPSITTTGNSHYLLSWQFLNPVTQAPMTDFGVQNIFGSPANWYYKFVNPISIGLTPAPTGTNLTGDIMVFATGINNVQTFMTPAYASNSSIACGLLSMQTGNAITSIYDYRVGDGRTQRVMFTQGDNLSYFELSDPTNHTIIYTGATTGDNLKWSHATFQNLLFSQQYGVTSGVAWDQIFTNPSGNWTQTMGLRPSFSGNSAFLLSTPSGTNISGGHYGTGIPSGSIFNVMLSTQILSGGLRSSNVVSVSGTTGNTYQIFGAPSPFNQASYPYDIYHVSGLAASGIATQGESQYNFDVSSNGTYVWATQNSGLVYYLAPLCDSSGNSYPNPMPNNNTWNTYPPFFSGNNASGVNSGPGVYLYDISFSGVNAQQVPNIINYGQNYLLSQVDTPKFKKMIVYNNLLIGIGDPKNPSRLWFSQQQAPQIWGDVGDINFGFYDIDVDNGQEITGIEVYKGYLIIFKENSTYSASYTSTAGNPLNIQNIDTNKGNLSIFSTVATSYGVFGLSQYGPVLATYYGVETIGDQILPFYQQLNHNDLIFSVAIHDVARQQIYWSITNSNDSPDNQIGLVYSYAEQAWGTRQNGMWNAAGTVGNTDNFAILMAGDTYGQIKQINSGVYTDDQLFIDVNQVSVSKNINMQWETPWLNFMNSQDLKQLKSLRVNCDESSQYLSIDVYFDQNDTAPVYTRYLNMSQPVWNRVVSLAGVCRTIKFVINSTGSPDRVKINSMQLTYMNRGQNTNI